MTYRIRDSHRAEDPLPDSSEVRALYVHVPFCRGKCGYCGFYSRPVGEGMLARYVSALEGELSSLGDALALPLTSVYVGGGTPTVLASVGLKRLLAWLGQFADDETEISVEARPADLDARTVELLAAAGVNRVTMGVQSFAAAELTALGRTQPWGDPEAAVEALRRAGITNIGMDVIYGLPGQTLDSWRASLDRCLAADVCHLSCYALSYDEGTPLTRDRDAGRVVEVPDERQEACYRLAVERTAAAGMERYEISNFARPGHRCRHNLAYWLDEPYLGLGPAAASFLEGVRKTNRPDLDAWLAAAESDGEIPADAERLTGRKKMAETLMLALRLAEGADRGRLFARYGLEPAAAFPATTRRYRELGMLEVTPTHIRLTPQAFFVADTILADFLGE